MRNAGNSAWSAGKRKEVLQLVDEGKAYFRYIYTGDKGEGTLRKVGLLLAVLNGSTTISYGWSLVNYQKDDKYDPDRAFAIALARAQSNLYLPDLKKGSKKDSAIDRYNAMLDEFISMAVSRLLKEE